MCRLAIGSISELLDRPAIAIDGAFNELFRDLKQFFLAVRLGSVGNKAQSVGKLPVLLLSARIARFAWNEGHFR